MTCERQAPIEPSWHQNTFFIVQLNNIMDNAEEPKKKYIDQRNDVVNKK